MANLREIKVDLDVWKEITNRMTSFTEQPNDVLRRVFNLDKSQKMNRFPQGEGVKLISRPHTPMSFKQAAIHVLREESRPLPYTEITDLAIKNGLIRTTGSTPHQTMSANLSTNSKGIDSIFIMEGKGYYSLRDSAEQKPETSFIHGYGFILKGKKHPNHSARGVLIDVMEEFGEQNPDFIQEFIARKHGKRRKFVAKEREELYTNRPDLAESYSHQLSNGFWVGTNYGKREIRKILQLACEVAGYEWGTDFEVYLGEKN